MYNWKLVSEGKVRKIYENLGGTRILLVATDAVSAFDQSLGVLIEGKGRMLTEISKYWFDLTNTIVPNAYMAAKLDFDSDYSYETVMDGKTVTQMVKLDMLPIEAIVRGYITGSMWKAYSEGEREFCGNRLCDGYEESERLVDQYGANAPIFTPTTKAPKGEHDQNLTFDEMVEHLGKNGVADPHGVAEWVRDYSFRLYNFAHDRLERRGIILADTKFEFGIDPNGVGNVILGDELLTPDSSRFWPLDDYEKGRPQKSLDKQVIRDYIKAHPGEEIPPRVLDEAKAVYAKITRIITKP